MELKPAIAHVVAGRSFTAAQIADVIGRIVDGEATPAQIGGLLVALRMKGETADEIAGAAQAMRARALTVRCPEAERAVDTCGTGGDGSGTANVSTIAAIVVAAAGARVAKHGNRALSSRAGSADVLEALGVAIDLGPEAVERCLVDVGIGFMFAPRFHLATRNATGPRRELGLRTLFNLLGPLTNPAGVANQIVGVFEPSFCASVALALGQLGARRAFVVHGHGGLDEIAVRGPTLMAEWNRARSAVAIREVAPHDFGLAEQDPAGLRGGDAAENAAIVRRILAGEAGALRCAVVMEAAVALVACDVAADFVEGAARAQAAIDGAAAARLLDRWIVASQAGQPPIAEPDEATRP